MFCIYMLTFLLVLNSAAIGKKVEGNLNIYPHQDYVEACVQLLHRLEGELDLYKEGPVDTELPFRFSITVDPEIHLDNLYIKIVMRRPKGYVCKLRDLKASESERMKDIPIRKADDLYYDAGQEMRAVIASEDTHEAKNRLAEVWYWATSASQVLVPCLDVADFLSKYKAERPYVVKILTDVEEKVGDAPITMQKRYWRLRRDATMRLVGFNDFKKIPIIEFAESVGDKKDPAAYKAWTDFTMSFAQTYEDNQDRWAATIRGKLTQDKIESLRVSYPHKEEVLWQLKTLEPVLGPTQVTK